MKKTKIAKIVSLVLTGAMCISAGALSACNNEPPVDEHNWATTWSTSETEHWYKCLDLNCTEVKDKAAHADADTDGDCDTCGYTVSTPGGENPGGENPGGENPGDEQPPEQKQVVVYFYNYNEWTLGVAAVDVDDKEDVLDGATAEAVADHAKWYQVTVPVDVNKVNFEITFTNTAEGAEDEPVTVTIIDEENVYISENGTYTSFADAEANPPIPMYQTVLHIQKPEDWTGTQGVAVYVYTGNGDNEYLGAWPLTSNTHSDEENGWLAIEINMPEANKGIAVNFIVFDVENNDEVTGAGRLNGSFNPADDVYFTADGKIFYAKADVDSYLEGQAPEGFVYVTVHIQVKFGEGGLPAGSDVYLYSWSNTGSLNNQFGSWPGTKLEDEGNGWYSARILMSEAQYNSKDFHLIVNNSIGGQYDAVDINATYTEYWVAIDGTVTETAPTE